MTGPDRGAEVRPTSVTRLLVPLDGSERAARAAPIARVLGDRLGVPAVFLGVATLSDDRGALRRAVEETADGCDSLVVESEDVATTIVDVAGRVPGTMVCMASHGRGRTAAFAGSVAAEVAAQTTEAMLVVGPNVEEPPARIDRVVACVDGSAASEWALPAAAAWAAALGVKMSIVTVAKPVPEPVTPGASHRSNDPAAAPESYLGTVAARWEDHGVEIGTAVVFDPVSVPAGLADYLKDSPNSLVAVATHGRTGLGRLAHGSMAAKIVHRLPAPVLLAPLPR